MPNLKTKAKKEIAALVTRFEENHSVYKSTGYNETQVRREFIDPFFAALGWDIDNKQGFAEQYKEVIHEDAVKVGGVTKAPDYSFRIGGVRKFLVEAKRPAVDIKGDVGPTYQLRRYAWSAGLPLSILTDFEELSVCDCRIRPYPKDPASVGRINYIRYHEYLGRFDEIYDVFSKEAILRGSFDKYAESTKGKRGTTGVDKEFLKEIEKWRELLAKNIALRNGKLSTEELNFSVQILIDRIIFLRICEDRGIEDYETLRVLGESKKVYAKLSGYFRKADEKYNSGIFDFRSDRITPALKIDDKVLKEILTSLYYPKSPYEFSVLGVEILGNVYEQFLGKVIRLTAGHQAKVEFKPEVKKAGGVYYTPKYIVDYIVKNTVGKLIKNKSPKAIEKIKILDPACGSGSFLIGAYTFLLDYHLDWYVKNNPKKHKKAVFQAGAEKWMLTTAEKKKILINNIFGVDIDTQAVEVTKLSLLLKVLENENRETLNQQMKLFREQALPSLEKNIRCGNSLIGPEFYEDRNFSLFENEEARRINVFDWNDEKNGFGNIMKSGGFDAVIGNPPYIRIQAMKEWAPVEVEEYKKTYQAASKGNYDIYTVLVEKGLSLLNQKGTLSFILPHKFFQAQYGEPLRKIISEGRHLGKVVDFGDGQVFAGATTYTCLLFLNKSGVKNLDYNKVLDLQEWRSSVETAGRTQLQTKRGLESAVCESGKIPSSGISASPWNFVVGKGAKLFERLSKMPVKLGDVADIFQGLVTGFDKAFILDSNKYVEKELLRPFLKSDSIQAYESPKTFLWMLFPYYLESGKAILIPQKDLIRKYRKT